MIPNDPTILALALAGGIIPALLWLWFWLREDNLRPEPRGLLTIMFFVGMLGVFLVIPIQKFIMNNISSEEWRIISWAGAEELVKYLAVVILLAKTPNIDEPVDWPIYLITAALGFAALENTLFILKPLSGGETTVGLLTGQLRFLGATLLHAVASGSVGIALGLSYFMGWFGRKIHLILGLCVAIVLHSAFNFFIMKDNGDNVLQVLSFLWVATILVMLLFEKLRRMSARI